MEMANPLSSNQLTKLLVSALILVMQFMTTLSCSSAQ
jgi:hypothetical protein